MVAAKSALRDQMKRRRAALPDAERAAGALRLAGLDLAELLGPPPLVVSLFRSMGDELDTGPLLERLSRLGYRTCLPVMQGRGKPLLFRAWSP
ncbi:MAG TPA: 5-formyltetrahydrofolate cyclo-ligase, partial [Hyphomicrobiaceae bacterium]|nr:5-formyltetrahydrofolate cyclo-ligase [Hyphomicrobiaceae bacterium]